MTRARAVTLLLPLCLAGCNVVLGIGDVSPLEAPDAGSESRDAGGATSAMATSADAAAAPRATDADVGADAATRPLAPDAASRADAAAPADAGPDADAATSDAAIEDRRDATTPDVTLDAAPSDDDAGATDHEAF